MDKKLFLDACRHAGIKDPTRLKCTPIEYKTAYDELLSDDTLANNVTNFHDKVGGGKFSTSQIIYTILSQTETEVRQVSPKPEWFDRFIATLAASAQNTWADISHHIENDINSKVTVAEAARYASEKTCTELTGYIDKIDEEKQNLLDLVQKLEIHRSENQDLINQIEKLSDKLSETKKHISDKDEDAKRLNEKLDKQSTELIRLSKMEGKYESLLEEHERLKQENSELITEHKMLVRTVTCLHEPTLESELPAKEALSLSQSGFPTNVELEGDTDAPF